jgi:hypothetical protein
MRSSTDECEATGTAITIRAGCRRRKMEMAVCMAEAAVMLSSTRIANLSRSSKRNASLRYALSSLCDFALSTAITSSSLAPPTFNHRIKFMIQHQRATSTDCSHRQRWIVPLSFVLECSATFRKCFGNQSAHSEVRKWTIVAIFPKRYSRYDHRRSFGCVGPVHKGL